VIVVAVTVLVLLAPGLSIIGGILLAVAVVCLCPALLALALTALMRPSERIRGSMLAIALVELRGTATRSVALAAVAALALYGSVAVEGARRDLLRGLDSAVVDYLRTADVWVTAANRNFLTVDGFADRGASAAIAKAPGVAEVRAYDGALLDVATRRLWVRGRPARDEPLLQPSQLQRGDLAAASTRIRGGGWAAVSSAFANERALHLGGRFVLPTPSGPVGLRVAAITTNVGWPPGAITINADEFRRWWQTSRPTALEIGLRPGVSDVAGAQIVRRALADRPGLLVQDVAERRAQYEASARQGLRSLGEISTLVLIASALAIAFALSATISARVGDIAARKTEGYSALQLWRALTAESVVLIGVGALGGAAFGLYGHALASRWLRVSQGFPAPFSPDLANMALTFAVLLAIASALFAVFGIRAARVNPRLSVPE
jgi:putative ABC transport system permease protein